MKQPVNDKIFIRLVADFWVDEKIVAVGRDAAFVYVALLGVAKAFKTHGELTRAHIALVERNKPDAYAEKLTDANLLTKIDDKWYITAWLKHNQEQAALSAVRAEAGRKSGESRLAASKARKAAVLFASESNKTSSQDVAVQEDRTKMNTSTLSVLSSSSTTQTTEVVKNSSTAKRRVLDDSGYEPDDPQYEFDQDYDGKEHIAYWREHGGKIQKPHESAVQASFMRMHNSFRRSKQEISALVAFVCSDADAKQWWLVGKTPADWCDEYKTDTGKQEPKWTRIRAAWLRKGGALPTAIRSQQKAPPYDPNCDCRRGWLEDEQGQEYPCPKCQLGQHLLKGGAN